MHNGFFVSRTRSILRRIHSSSFDNCNARIIHLVQQGQYREALGLHSRLTRSNTSRFVFPSLLKACTSLSDFRYGGVLQSSVIKLGLHSDPYIVNSLIRLYIAVGCPHSAHKLFDNESQMEISFWDTALWNSIIDGYFKIGFFEEGMAQFSQMILLNVKPDGYTLCILLGMCSSFPDSLCGKEVHGYAIRNCCDDDPFIATALIDMYSGSSRLVDASNIFEKFQKKSNVAVWNSMISGFCHNGLWRNAFQLFKTAKSKGLHLGSASFASLLVASSESNDVYIASQLHCDVVKTGFHDDPYVCTSLITLYSNCGCLEDAERILCLDDDQEVEVWNATISAYTNHGRADDALDIYSRMRRREVMPDSFTISTALIACIVTGSFFMATLIHGELFKRLMEDSMSIQSALLTMYSKLGKAKEARRVFSEIQQKDVIAWGSMISGTFENMEFKEALILFRSMLQSDLKPDPYILATALNSCSGLGYNGFGCSIHGFAVKSGLDFYAFTGNALIEFYSRCGQPDMARKSFSTVLRNNLAVWNSLMSCYALNAMPDISLLLLPQILKDGLSLDCISITIALSSISQMAALITGKATHCHFIRSQLPQEIQVENSLLDMYIKCGCFIYALRVFSSLPRKDIFAWNSMISGHGSHGEYPKAMDLFMEMKRSGVAPDEITFLSLISSCNHCGFVDEGLELFYSMKEHGVEPKIDHYVSVVDLLGRAGRLVEACDFIDNMAIVPERSIWISLLSASRVHRNVQVGETAANRLIEMDPSRGSSYSQLLNLYLEAGLKEKAAKLRAVMRQQGVKKLPGCSWIHVKDNVQVFFSGGSYSHITARIYQQLESLENSVHVLNRKTNPFR